MKRPSSFQSVLRHIGDTFGDKGVSDKMLTYLIAATYSAPATLYASAGMGLAVALGAWAATREAFFLGVFFCLGIVFIVRLHLTHAFNNAMGRSLTREALDAFDTKLQSCAVLYSALIGVVMFGILACDIVPFGIAGSVGFTLSYATRSGGRIRLLFYQMAATSAPTLIAFMVMPIDHGPIYAILILGTVGAAFFIGRESNRNLLALYRANERNQLIARTDKLTGLHNRFAFGEALNARIAMHAKTGSSPFAIMIIDLDRFKEINDSMGHNIGDAVIIQVSDRLRAAVGPHDLVARLGGDEFVVIAPDLHDVQAVSGRARVLVSTLSAPLDLPETAWPMSASVGVARFPEQGATADDLMKKADIALYEAKRRGRNTACLFDDAMQNEIDARRIIESDMVKAFSDHQFEPWFQPIVNLPDGNIVGYEALARWRHPTKGLIAPDQFISIAEHNGMIAELGDTILRQACHAAARWDARRTIAVNMSPVQFLRPQQLLASVQGALAASQLQPSRLYLEITESLLIADSQQARSAILQLADMGVRFALDDFGAGYSSLAYIQDYPFSRIKIDKKFVETLEKDQKSGAIIAAVNELGRRIDLDVVAEGVETEQQRLILLSIGVTLGQGYIFGKPAPQFGAEPSRFVA